MSADPDPKRQMIETMPHVRPPLERDPYLQVVAMSPAAAKRFAGRTDEPVDLGPPTYPDRHKPGARLYGFRDLLDLVSVPVPYKPILRCDCCASSIELVNGIPDYATDDEVCQGSDDPGFYLCARPGCLARRDRLSLDELRELYAEGRARGEAIERERRTVAIVKAPADRDQYEMRVMRDADDLAIRIAREVDNANADAAKLAPMQSLERAAVRAHAYQRIALLVEAYTIKTGVDVADQIAEAEKAGVM